MDGARLSRFPHLTWLGYRFEAPAGVGRCCYNFKGTVHSLHMVFAEPERVRWVSRGHETDFNVRAGSFHYLPADDESHTIVADPEGAIRSFTMFIPRRHIANLAAADHMEGPLELHRLLVHDDAALQACMTRLARAIVADVADADGSTDETARRLVLRLCELQGARRPDWHDDVSAFDRRALANLVAHIDEHLRHAPSLGEMAVISGLSPSHCAKKFRQSVGLSLHRFINRRRLQRSLGMLRNPSVPLAGMAVELGFSSQSHFTRLFSNLTGMTPAKYQKQFRPTVG